MSVVDEGLYGAILVPFGALTAGVDVYAWIGGFAVDRGVESIICNFNIYVENVEFIAGGYFMRELEDQGSNINCSKLSMTMNMSSMYLQYRLCLR